MSATHLTFTVSNDCYSNIAGLRINGYKHGSRTQDEKVGREDDLERNCIVFRTVCRFGVAT